MIERHLLTSLTRIADFDREDFEIRPLPRDHWANADYVAAHVHGVPSSLYRIELANGRMMDAMQGASVIGAFGRRAATLEAVGDWAKIGEDGIIEALTGAGLFGKATSVAPWLGKMIRLSYRGHVLRNGRKLGMGDFVAPLRAGEQEFAIPVVLLVGTSMSAGKTTTGRLIIHQLSRRGLRVAGAKLTGAGRYRDVLSFHDAGADSIIDFVDAGLPSTVVPEDEFRTAMQYMLRRIAATHADVLVAEAGASPLEPYNGHAAIEALGGNVRCTILCASDPYAVLGVQTAFGIAPDLVTGPAANTKAGIELVRKLTGLTAYNLQRESSLPELLALLHDRLPAGMFGGPGGGAQASGVSGGLH